MGVVLSVLLMFYLFGLQLVGKSKLGSLFLELGKLVVVFGHLLEGGLDELALHVTDGDGELVDLKVTEDNFTLGGRTSLPQVSTTCRNIAGRFSSAHLWRHFQEKLWFPISCSISDVQSCRTVKQSFDLCFPSSWK